MSHIIIEFKVLEAMQCYAKVMAMALVCKLEQCDMVVCELIAAVHYAITHVLRQLR